MTVLRLPESAENRPEISTSENGFRSLPVPPGMARCRRRNTAYKGGAAGIFCNGNGRQYFRAIARLRLCQPLYCMVGAKEGSRGGLAKSRAD